MLDPLIILAIGLFIVLGMILCLRANAFIALISAAFAISFLAPVPETGDIWAAKIIRVTSEFGNMAGKIGILIVMGAIIGKCLMGSGAAERIVLAMGRLFGQKRVPSAFLCSGFVLSIPVFYDTTLYLLLPLARTFYRLIRKDYVLLITAIGVGATISHTLIPPTPGPLVVAKELNLSIASVMLVGFLVSTCLMPFAIAGCYLVNWYMPKPHIIPELEEPELLHEDFFSQTDASTKYPTLFLSLAPIFLPVILIAANACIKMSGSSGNAFANAISVLGDANIALAIAALFAAVVFVKQKRLSLAEFSKNMESAIADAGSIVLITAAGGAFGAMLRAANIGSRISELFSQNGSMSGIGILCFAFLLASLIKTAQGSSTTAMITTASIIGSLSLNSETLGFHPAYIATTIGLGSMSIAWMNDSGFWVFCRMGRINEIDALKTYSVLLAMTTCIGFGIVLALSRLLPLC